MKDHVKIIICLVFVIALVSMLSSCASIDCNTFKKTGDPEIDNAFYNKCREKKVKLINKGLHVIDKTEEKVIEGIDKL